MNASSRNERARSGLTRSAQSLRGGSAAGRLWEARYTLGAAAGLLAATTLWEVPIAFALGAIAALILLTAFVPRRSSASPVTGNARGSNPAWSEVPAEAMLEAFPQAGLILDVAGTVQHANRQAAKLFPATRRGDPFVFTFRAPEIAGALDEAQAGRATSVEFHEPGERTQAYLLRLAPIASASESGLVLVAVEDASERQAIARMRSDFVANASHELRTPLASLTGFIETLLGPARGDPQATEKFLRVMLDQAQRMRRLIEDLLSLSRLEMRVHQRSTDRVDLVAVLHHVRDALGPLAHEAGVAVEIDAPPGEAAVTGDRDELVQVFGNLLENAIRYGGSGGRVDLRLETRGTDWRVVVHVKDYGPGIPREHLPRLTERFYRAGASGEARGTGLGLAIVKHIVTRHKGQLVVKSRPGEGARFTVELPLARPGEVEGNG
jgi:two-component system phosphate regulon sensor histidine kinase PhoR